MWVSLLPAGQQDIVFSGLLCFQISCLYHHYLHPTLRWRSLFLLQRLCLYELFLLLITISLCIHLRCTLSTSLHLLFKDFLCYWQTLLCCQLPSSLPSQCCTAATASVELPYQSRLHKSGEADVAHLPYSNIFRFKYMLGISFILMPMCMCACVCVCLWAVTALAFVMSIVAYLQLIFSQSATLYALLTLMPGCSLLAG